MQIYALDSQGKLTPVSQATRGKSYQCPECLGALSLKGGQLRQLHFYHLGPSDCRQRGKSLTHLNIQLAIQKMFSPLPILLEHRMPEINRIADAFCPDKKLVFEVQVSPIAAEEVDARTQSYRAMGYEVIWILHDRQFNRTQMTPAELRLRFSTHYFTNINAFGKGYFYDQYAEIRFKRRIRRSRRLLIWLHKIIPTSRKQIPSQLPKERRSWKYCAEGDLFHKPFYVQGKKRPLFFYLGSLLRFYRGILNLLLEKTTY